MVELFLQFRPIFYYYFLFPFSFSLSIYFIFFNFCLNLIQYASLLIFHSTFFIPFCIHVVNFTFFLSTAPNPNSHWCSSFYPLKIVFLSVGHLISTLLSYNSLNFLTLSLILVNLLLIVGLWEGVIFENVDLYPGLCGFLLAVPAQTHTKCGG